MPRCASVTPRIAQYRSATTAASDLLSACVVGMLGRNNEYIEHTPGQISAPAKESAVGRHPGLGRGSSCGDLLAGLRLRRYFTEMMV